MLFAWSIASALRLRGGLTQIPSLRDEEASSGTLAWITRSRRTVRDYERLPGHHETMVYWAMIIVMTRRLASLNQSHQLHPT